MAPLRLTFEQGTSSKFWEIAVDDSEYTVSWGRIGTAGQTKTKSFPSAEKAAAAAEKLIAEKRGKGYVDDDGEPVEHSAAPGGAAAPVRTAPERRAESAVPPGSGVDLEPHEWARATWRPLPEPPGLPRPFDRDAAAADLKRSLKTDGWRWIWLEKPFSEPITAEEAYAWLVVCDGSTRRTRTEAVKAMAQFDRPVDPADVYTLASQSELPGSLALQAVVTIIGAEDVAEWLARPTSAQNTSKQHGWLTRDLRSEFASGVRAYLYPLLDQPGRERFEAAVRSRLAKVTWPGSTGNQLYDTPDSAFFLAAQIGLHEDVMAVVDAWPEDAYRGAEWEDHYHRPQDMVFGLATADEMRETFERLGLRFRSPAHVAAWLAHTELDALDVVADGIAKVTNRDEAEAMLNVLARAHGVEVTPVMLALTKSSKAPSVARQWLADHPQDALAGAARMLGATGKSRELALEFLRARHRAGDDFDAMLEQLDAAAAARVREHVIEQADRAGPELAHDDLPEALAEALDGAPTKKLPAWLDVAALPAVVLEGRGYLGEPDVTALLRALAPAKPDEPPPAIAQVLNAHADTGSLDAFAWSLFEAWQAEGAPPAAKWTMLAIGWLGGDRSATRLAPLIRAWPGESQHARAVLGLGVLGAIGSDTSLMLLSGIAQRVKFKGLQTKAREAMDEIAAAKGMTKAELEDRIVPDGGLDEQGSRVFDYGPRSFSFVLGPGMKPMVRDENGKVRASPPKPGARDDEALAGRALEDWKLLRKQVGEVAKVQAQRLEQAMVTQRRWSVEDFERFLVEHPLQRHLVRLLVWGAWRDAQLETTFRVTDEQDYADQEDEACELDPATEIGVVHSLQLDEAARGAWGDILADYELVPPFAQLGRPVHEPDPDDLDQRNLTRFKHRKIGASTLVRMLENLGWERGQPQDAGIFSLHAKPFPALGVTAVVEYEGVPVGAIVEWEDQSIESCYVLDRALRSAHELGWGGFDRGKGTLRWAEVDPIVCSEVLADVAAILEKAR